MRSAREPKSHRIQEQIERRIAAILGLMTRLPGDGYVWPLDPRLGAHDRNAEYPCALGAAESRGDWGCGGDKKSDAAPPTNECGLNEVHMYVYFGI
jgi:hypothetical protein